MRQKLGNGWEKVIGNLEDSTAQESGSNSAVSEWWEEAENTGEKVRLCGIFSLLLVFLRAGLLKMYRTEQLL